MALTKEQALILCDTFDVQSMDDVEVADLQANSPDLLLAIYALMDIAQGIGDAPPAPLYHGDGPDDDPRWAAFHGQGLA